MTNSGNLVAHLITGAHDVCAVNVKASFDQRSFVSAEFYGAREMQLFSWAREILRFWSHLVDLELDLSPDYRVTSTR